MKTVLTFNRILRKIKENFKLIHLTLEILVRLGWMSHTTILMFQSRAQVAFTPAIYIIPHLTRDVKRKLEMDFHPSIRAISFSVLTLVFIYRC